MARRVGVIGTGWVGASVAVSLLQSGTVDELWLSDVRQELAEGEAMDLAHGAAFYPPATVRVATVAEMAACDIVIVCAGRGGSATESRLNLLRDNAAIIASIGQALAGFPGLIIVVTNPVDVLTQVMTVASGLPPARVLGTGTMLDTARLRQMLGQALQVEPRSVQAQVVGEHGDSEVVLWSSATIAGLPLAHFPGWSTTQEAPIQTAVRTAAYEIIRRKGATNHAIGWVTADLVRCILRNERRVLTVARRIDGACGLQDVALSLPMIVGATGAEQILEPHLSPTEAEQLKHSAAVLRQAYQPLLTPSERA